MTSPFKGKKHTEEAKLKNRLAHLGRTPWNKGIVGYSNKWSIVAKKHFNEIRKGENNNNWRGVRVGYRSLHKWVERIMGKPRNCEFCGNDNLNHRQYHWANKSREYKRSLSDWMRLCVKCHRTYDRNMVHI